jgi:hypothetical protein
MQARGAEVSEKLHSVCAGKNKGQRDHVLVLLTPYGKYEPQFQRQSPAKKVLSGRPKFCQGHDTVIELRLTVTGRDFL